MFRNKSASSHQFAMVPRADIPRSAFKMEKALKTAFNASVLVPILVEEVLPGDSWRLKMTAFCRLATPIFPFMDNLHFETWFFFVPNRLVWDNWVKMNGEQKQLGDSISYTVPQVVSPAGGYPIGSIADYMGLPTVGQVVAGFTVSHSALPIRGYWLIFNEWFRDQNLVSSISNGYETGNGPDSNGFASATPANRGKRHDYFTGCLPFVQKGNPVSLPLTGNATVKTLLNSSLLSGAQPAMMMKLAATGADPATNVAMGLGTPPGGSLGNAAIAATGGVTAGGGGLYPANLYADLSTVTATTINSLRLAFQTQKVLERDARGGTRYTELIRAHFGVVSPDARLQRPEYLGGGHQMISVNPIAQTSATGLTGATTPQGNLSAMGTMLASGHGFTQSFTEHGYIIGLCNVRADLTYQQGLRRHWSRQTRYDFYLPAFAALGEQAVLNREIYCDGSSNDALTFGYQERWAEYRYNPSEITGLMRSTAAGTIDPWHLSQRFTALPTLNSTFINESVPLSRVLAVGAGANGQQLLGDFFYSMVVARPMPTYSVPGLIDHF